ncbi:MAG: NAD(P)/FAD-dependent oxidoreductase [Burkholderiales bacterium]
MSSSVSHKKFQIVGAGPAGLAAAITLARAGRPVVVHEVAAEVGSRFQGDHQGLENWTTEHDVLDDLREQGIACNFAAIPCREGIAFDTWGNRYEIHSDNPLFYLVERGPGAGTLDSALLAQARELGVEICFNSRVKQLEGSGILAAGPRAADAIAVGFHFETAMPDGWWVICDDDLAPQGYAYLLITNGRGTVKSCMFSGFKRESEYVTRTVERFCQLVGLDMKNPQPHGGAGNFRIPASAYSGIHPIVGEQAGFQDMLWGFGMRFAIASGVLAARSLIDSDNYDARWRRELDPLLRTALVNRAVYGALGNRGYRWFLRWASGSADVRGLLRRYYHPTLVNRLLYPWAHFRVQSRRRDVTCNHIDCTCVWCRCGGAV